MKYDYCVLSTPSDFYLADAISREIEKNGKTCYFNLRDSNKKDPTNQIIDILNSGTTLVAIVNEEFSSTSKYKPLLKAALSILKNYVKTFILKSEPISNVPREWLRTSQIDISEGITKDLFILIGLDANANAIVNNSPTPAAATAFAAATTATSTTAQLHEQAQPTHTKTSGQMSLRAGRVDLLDLIPTPDNSSLTLQRAMRYLKGDGVPQDSERAISLFKKAAAETPEDPTAQFCLGICLESEGSDAAIGEAYNAYTKALEAGYTPALTRLAFTSFSMKTKDNAEARELFTKALTMNDATGAYGLGLLDEAEGKYDDAVEHYSEAAELGNHLAQNALGCLYAEGKGVTASEEKAMQWFEFAAAEGLPQALFNCGIRLMASNVAENKQKGEDMLQEAANKGLEPAQMAMKEIEAAKIAEQRRKQAEQQRQEARNKNNNRNNNGSGGNAWGEFFDALDLGGLAGYAKDRLG